MGAPWKQYLFSYGTDEVTSSKLLTAEQGQTDKCLQANGMGHIRCKILSVWPIKIFQARQVPRATTQEMTKSLDDRRSWSLLTYITRSERGRKKTYYVEPKIKSLLQASALLIYVQNTTNQMEIQIVFHEMSSILPAAGPLRPDLYCIPHPGEKSPIFFFLNLILIHSAKKIQVCCSWQFELPKATWSLTLQKTKEPA